MVETLLEEVREHIAESSKHIDQAKGVVNDACQDFVRKSKRAVKAAAEPLRISWMMPNTRSSDIRSQRWRVAS